jgi:hypothetical protein
MSSFPFSFSTAVLPYHSTTGIARGFSGFLHITRLRRNGFFGKHLYSFWSTTDFSPLEPVQGFLSTDCYIICDATDMTRPNKLPTLSMKPINLIAHKPLSSVSPWVQMVLLVQQDLGDGAIEVALA